MTGGLILWKKLINNMEDNKELSIPENELRIESVRSGGKGGQNVNKVATKAKIWWNVGASAMLNSEEKERVRNALANRINDRDELLIESQETRSQLENKKLAIERLTRLVRSALVVQEERVATKPTESSIVRRLVEKDRLARLKEGRKKRQYSQSDE